MIDSPKILYMGAEFTPDNQFRSHIMTDDPFVVIADMLLKARKPYGSKPNRNKKYMYTFSKVSLGSIKVPNPNYLDIFMETRSVQSNEIVSMYRIVTKKTDKEFSDTAINPKSDAELKQSLHIEFGSKTSIFYQGPSYEFALRDLAFKLKKATDNNIALAKVLATYASVSPEHPIWEQNTPGQKGMGLGYKSRWNHTNWSGLF